MKPKDRLVGALGYLFVIFISMIAFYITYFQHYIFVGTAIVSALAFKLNVDKYYQETPYIEGNYDE